VRRPILCAIIGSTLIAMSLCGSTWRTNHPNNASPAELALYTEGHRLYDSGQYTRAIAVFRSAALQAERDGSPRQAAMNWNNAGGAALARMDFRDALPAFQKARSIAQISGQTGPELVAMNNIADLYLQMGDTAGAARIVREALAKSGPGTDSGTVSRLRYHLASSLSFLHHFDEAEPVYRRAISEMGSDATNPADLEFLARMLGNFGDQCLEAGKLDEAEDALSEALRVVRTHRLSASANILRGLAKLRARQGDARSAAALFDAALQSRQTLTPQWVIYTDRAEFRLKQNDLPGALADFREARTIAAQMRADVVPADRDRIAMAGGLNRIPSGLVEAGNRLAQKTGDSALIRETFDAAEQDRLWSLRELAPSANDWRTRLPEDYWDRLARYQSIERSLLALSPADPQAPELTAKAATLETELQELEASAADPAHPAGPVAESALDHARGTLDPDTVLFSFHTTGATGWMWVVDKQGVDLYPIPQSTDLSKQIKHFAIAIREGQASSESEGEALYRELFSQIRHRHRNAGTWLLALDGPLFDLPFGALVSGHRPFLQNKPIYLAETKVLQAIPGAAMIQRKSPVTGGSFLGIGDPIYSAADSRYTGKHGIAVALPRLPATAQEVEACSRAWSSGRSTILTGADARLDLVRAAMQLNPAVIHFATHIVQSPAGHSSGLIALGLDPGGGMGLMGPTEILARSVTASLVVLNGCHSAQSETVPGDGLMGLTRAWIGAGARSVLATQWDIPDEGGAGIMIEFYKALHANPLRGPAWALQQAQIRTMKLSRGTGTPAVWGAYFVIGRES
jgi:CHAT domain-containing protein